MPKLDDLAGPEGAGSWRIVKQDSSTSSSSKVEEGHRKLESSSNKVSPAEPENSSRWVNVGSSMTSGGGFDFDPTIHS